MSINIAQLVRDIDPANTVLIFGSGSSIPSGAPSVNAILDRFSKDFGKPHVGFTLSEFSTLIEKEFSRHKLIGCVRSMISDLRPSGGLRNISLYPWKSIYTTNYDNLIEQSYADRGHVARVYSSSFDFAARNIVSQVELFKFHGTIEKDIIDGQQSRIIITEGDYENAYQYREYIYDRMKGDIAGADVVIIGHSLADNDLKEIINRAASLNAGLLGPAKIALLLYTHDEDRAYLFERKGMTVAFGGIDDFFIELSKRPKPAAGPAIISNSPIAQFATIAASSLDVSRSIGIQADESSMFNGRAATYADISAGYTFKRGVAAEIEAYYEQESSLCAVILGASGVGKTTAVRQAVLSMSKKGMHCYEHDDDHSLVVDEWVSLSEKLRSDGEVGVLVIDSAHNHLHEINILVDRIVSNDNGHLKLVFISSRNLWHPRIKTPNISKYGIELRISRLKPEEIDELLRLIDVNPKISALVEPSFGGFSTPERKRRLVDRCQSDTFVCLKNIFGSEPFDDIILKEYNELEAPRQDVYRHIAAMETAGVRVHRQLVIRLLGISASSVSSTLENLMDIISEYTIDQKLGLYGWKCRHAVISSIVTKYKFADLGQTISLFEKVIDAISPTYDIEIRTLRDLCNFETGISRIPDINTQNRLLRKMMSVAPGERIPRHRLIRNLIETRAFDKAETEIRLFNKDFGSDGPVHRYKIKLVIARAVNTPGLVKEDRKVILDQAYSIAVAGAEKYKDNKNILAAFADLGIESYRLTGSYQYFDEAMARLKDAEEVTGDEEIGKIIIKYERRIAGKPYEDVEIIEDGE